MHSTSSKTSATASSDQTASTDQTASSDQTQPDQTQPTPGRTTRASQPRLGPDVAEAMWGAWGDIRRASRERAAMPALQKIEGLSMAEHRERCLGQLSTLVEMGAVQRAYPQRFGGSDDPGGNIAAFEELVAADPSLQIKSGVQWGLFGAAVLHLGTEAHHEKWLPGIMDLSIPGAFAMTETGHGSDVASIATTATYDPASEEFVLHTPFRGAWKDYLGNAALHGRAATVFAHLITGGVDYGVHCFYVPIRDEAGAFLPGVGGEDDGLKGGLNGIDNGRLHFTNVRVPRTNLLNRYGDVAPDGTYTSPIASPGRRFFTMLSALVQGRVSLDGACVVASKIGLSIATRYATERRQFTASNPHEEVLLLDYQTHQRRLITRIATTYAMHFAHEELLGVFDDVFSGRKASDQDQQYLETYAAALKPLSTWHALDTLQECREACGGAGFLTENRFTSLRADLDVYVTFEGDNHVLLQLVAKRLLTDYAKEFSTVDVSSIARLVLDKASDVALYRTPLARITQNFSDAGSTARSVINLRAPEEQEELLKDRVDAMVAQAAAALRQARGHDKARSAQIFNAHQTLLIEAARAHAELLQWQAFTRGLAQLTDPGSIEVLTWVRDLFGLSLIEKHLSWYLMHNRITPQRGRALVGYINRLLTRLRPHARDLVDAWGYGDDLTRAKISSGAEAKRQDEARDYFRAQRASGTAPRTQEAPRKNRAGRGE
ncbi:acyl-CoA dehydrogenase family protein [Micrococcales bacterium 31B]|nr:acyl-CoA dehydrogenase family protein [Micrococcales bacterium 31B]